MFLHNSTVFKNNCLKTPVNPDNNLPNPRFQRRPHSAVLDSKEEEPLNSRTNKNNKMERNSDDEKLEKKSNKINQQNNKESDCETFLSLIDFYESIPEYNEINHLSEKEFYLHRDTLRRKQKEIRNLCLSKTSNYLRKSQIVSNQTPSSYDELLDENDSSTNEKYMKNCNNFTTLVDEKSSKYRDLNSKTPPVRFSDKDSFFDDESSLPLINHIRKTNLSTKSTNKVRKSSAKSGSSFFNFSDDEFISPKPPILKSSSSCALRSKSISPCRQNLATPTVTIPKPFKMTQREEEEKILDDLIMASKCFTTITSPKCSPKKEKNNHQFKATPVPLTSRIPLYKHILAEQEHK